MKMGEYIKYLRSEKKWSQEELGRMLHPPVNRAAVNKWETGIVENLKRSYILQLSKIFDVTPTELMCFDSKHNEDSISKEVRVIEEIQEVFGKDVVQLLQHFNELNEIGKEKLLDEVQDLIQLPKYTDKVQGKFKVVQGGVQGKK